MDTRCTICFVTDELHPFTAGGIGRLLANFIAARKDEVAMHLLLPSCCRIDERQVRTHYPGVIVHRAAARPWLKLWSTGYEDRMSREICAALRKIAQRVHFDFVEFPDFRGWAAAALSARQRRGGFPHGEITVRLHGAYGVIAALEGRSTRPGDRIAALERFALCHADRLVAPLPLVAEAYRAFYGFSESWRRRVEIAFPPPCGPFVPPPRLACQENRDLIFITRVDPVKRPHLFAQAAERFMHRVPEFGGRAIFACMVNDSELWTRIQRGLDAGTAHRFSHVDSGEERSRLIPGNIVVIPSGFETLCLAAYEAAAAGATLVLNRACPAFGDGSPFASPEAAFHFDGTVDDLAQAMEAAWRSPPLRGPRWSADPQYFETADPARTG